jgi:hypothetical protein
LIDALTPQQVASITGYSFILDALSVAGILEIGITSSYPFASSLLEQPQEWSN